MTAFLPPLKVHLCWFDGKGVKPQCAAIAKELYEFLHRPLGEDVVMRPGLEIPVEYGRSLEGLLDALEAGSEPKVGARLVVAILDKASYEREGDQKTIKRASQRWPGVLDGEVFVPIVLHRAWYGKLFKGAERMLAAVAVPQDLSTPRNKDRRWRLGSEVAVVAARALLRRAGGGKPPKPQVFFSHTKADGLALTESLITHFQKKTKLDPWYDGADVSHGEELGNQLDLATGHGVVLVVRTDRYSESPWCGRELLTAKQAGTPIVTLLATSDGEPLASAYGGNHRTMNWSAGREWEVVGRCAQAWLHGHHFHAHARAALARAGLPSDTEVIPRRPELLDLWRTDAGGGRSILVHPDPPVTAQELDLLRRSRPSVRLATPSTLFGRVLLADDPMPPLENINIGFSLSIAEELPKIEDGRIGNGLTKAHVDDVIAAIVLATLSSGASIAYGGDFRKSDSYTQMLADLHVSRRRLGTGSRSQLQCYVDPSMGGRHGDGGDFEYGAVTVEAPAGADGFPSKLRLLVWTLAMRHKMATTCDARVIVGGKVRPQQKADDGGYTSPWPGLLEEAWRTLEQDRALYVIGGFGGAAGVISKMLLKDAIPDELTTTHPANAPLGARAAKLDKMRTLLREKGADPAMLMATAGGFAGMSEMASSTLERWREFAGGSKTRWNNGLSVDENVRLFQSTDSTEITHLVFEGLRRVAARRPATPTVALYHGDIASVPNVAAYAVPVSPGIKPEGAAKALDARMNKRIEGCTWTEGQRVALIETDSAELAGARVVAVRLPVPTPGTTIDVAQVEELARLAATEMDKLGMTSVAVVPFATTWGVSAGDSAQAIERGFRAGGGLEKKIVFCEADGERYRQLLKAFPDASELRAGPSPIPSRASLILNVAVEAPGQAAPYGHFSSTLIVPDSGAPVVPLFEGQLDWPKWFTARDRYDDFAAAARMGNELWKTVLSPVMREQIAEHVDRPLVVVSNRDASGLPWELLTDEKGQAPARSAGLIRRIALDGATSELRPRGGLGTVLRVLLVYVPKGLRSVVPEKEEIEAALRGRADMVVDSLDTPTCEQLTARLKDGFYDVLHYAGHASFDEANPGRSGLRLADKEVFTAAHMAALSSPRFVFLSACESGRTRRDEPQQDAPSIAAERPLAEGFLRHGVEALLGTFFAVDDRAARAFAKKVYTDLAAGEKLGTAVKNARVERHGAGDPDWANFLLYGDESLVL